MNCDRNFEEWSSDIYSWVLESEYIGNSLSILKNYIIEILRKNEITISTKFVDVNREDDENEEYVLFIVNKYLKLKRNSCF
jgi:hypothetical protein